MRLQLGKTFGVAFLGLAMIGISGCSGGPSKRALAANEPGLALQDGETIVDAKPPRATTWVDRHPLFSQPRDYYESTNRNVVVKTAAATVIGIPAGIIGEAKQIVVGKEPSGF